MEDFRKKFKIRKGDMREISEIVRCSYSMVVEVLSGRRNQETKLGKKIVKAAKEMYDFREDMKSRYQEAKFEPSTAVH